MFEGLDTSDVESFREDLVRMLAEQLHGLKARHPGMEDGKAWGLMQEIKGKIFGDTLSVASILKQVEGFEAFTGVGESDLSALKMSLLDVGKSSAYAAILAADIKQHPEEVKKAPVLAAPSGAALFADLDRTRTQAADIKGRLIKQLGSLEEKKVDKSELVKFLMSERERAHASSYNPYFVDVHQLPTPPLIPDSKLTLDDVNKFTDQQIAAKIDAIIEHSKSRGLNRVQLILRFTDHYVPVDFDIAKKSCFVFDAASDFRRMRLQSLVKHSTNISEVTDAAGKPYMHGEEKRDGKLQKSERGCWLYALHMSRSASEMKELHSDLVALAAVKDGIRHVNWTQLAPDMVKMSESTLFFDYLKSKRPELVREIDLLTHNNEKGYGFKAVLSDYQTQLNSLCLASTVGAMEEQLEKFHKKQELVVAPSATIKVISAG